MTTSEFLDTLRTQLEGALTPAQIEGHIHYYKEYIAQEIASGKTESEVLDGLGSPVFIARTLLDVEESENGGYEREQKAYRTGNYGADAYEEDSYGTDDYGAGDYRTEVHTWNIHPLVLKWGIPIAIFLVLFLLLVLVGSVIAVVARLFVPLILIIFVIYIFRNRE